jgi:hypothetical protein
MKKQLKIEDLVWDCLNHGIRVVGVGIKGDGLSYDIDGFSKSGTATLYEEDGAFFLESRYNQIDEIESFEDIAAVAYDWNLGYCDREPFGWDARWLPVFQKLGWVDVEEITTKKVVITPKTK